MAYKLCHTKTNPAYYPDTQPPAHESDIRVLSYNIEEIRKIKVSSPVTSASSILKVGKSHWQINILNIINPDKTGFVMALEKR